MPGSIHLQTRYLNTPPLLFQIILLPSLMSNAVTVRFLVYKCIFFISLRQRGVSPREKMCFVKATFFNKQSSTFGNKYSLKLNRVPGSY